MKRIVTLFAALLAAALSYSQPKSPRLILVEEFTNASCGPCASANPALNTLLNNNNSKVVAIKYQVSWPGYDPMYAQNPTQSDTRVSYYGVTGVPNVKMDGNVYSGSPGGFTQTHITNEFGVSSPFTINVDHVLSPDFDSIYIAVYIEATAAVTGTLKAHTVIVENTIEFASAPGSNGETDFYDVMRKMLPDANGAALASSWAVGDKDTLYFSVPLPNYIYDVNEVAVVAFIQDNANKNVKQAGYSPMIAQTGDANLDAGISVVSNVPVFICSANFTPSVTLKNFGTTVLTSATINYQIDNGTVQTQPWTGSLAANATSSITLPAQTAAAGAHTFTVWVSQPNGAPGDFYIDNNTIVKNFNVVSFIAPVPVSEGFQASAFPPTNWLLNNSDGADTWERTTAAGGFGLSNASTTLKFYNISDGQIDELILPSMDFSTASSLALTFDVAYARYNGSLFDQLKVDISTNCGSSWTSIYNKSGSSLATAPDATSAFVPTSSQWRKETVDLSSYSGQSQVFIKFKGISGYGNNLYIDNINVSEASAVTESANADIALNIFPNPFTGQANVEFSLPKSAEVSMVVYNLLGSLIYSEDLGTMQAGNSTVVLNGESFSPGFYYLTLNIGGELFTKKISVVR